MSTTAAVSGVDASFKPALFLMAGRTVAFAATFFMPVVLARLFSQAEFGTYKQIFLVWMTLHGAVQFGLAESLFYFIPLAPRAAGRHVANAIVFLAASGLAGLVLLATTRTTVADWLSNPALAAYLPLLGVFLVLMLIATVLEIVMISHGRYLQASATYGASDMLRAVFFLAPVLVAPSLESVMLGAVIFAAFRMTATLIYCGRVFGRDLRPSLALFRSQIAYAAPYSLAMFLAVFESTFHQYAVAHAFDVATFAIYAVGCLQIPLVDFLTTSASNVMMVRMGDAIRAGRRDVLLGFWHATTRQLALVLTPLVGLLVVIAHPLIVLLFTDAYRASVPIFVTASTSILLMIPNTDGVLRVYADTRFILLRNAVRAVLVLALIRPFMAWLGLPGAVLVTVLALLAGKVLDLGRMRSLLDVGWAGLIPWRTLAAIVAASAAGVLVAGGFVVAVGPHPLIELGGAGLLYVGTYLALLVRFRLVSEGETQAILGWLRSWIRRAERPGALAAGARRVPPTN